MLQLDVYLSSHFTLPELRLYLYIDTQLHRILPWVDIKRNGNKFFMHYIMNNCNAVLDNLTLLKSPLLIHGATY